MRALARVAGVVVFVGVVAWVARETGTGVRAASPVVAPAHVDARQPDVRMLIVNNTDALHVEIHGRARLEAVLPDTTARQFAPDKPGTFLVKPLASGLRFGDQPFIRVRIVPEGNRPVRLRWQEPDEKGVMKEQRVECRFPVEVYRTEVARGRDTEARLRARMHLPMEEYLPGVLSAENFGNWSLEAFRAQAIASRTFSLYEAQVRRSKEWDVTRDVMSQAWKDGYVPERMRQAVRSTEGVVLTERGGLFCAYFHACCGGWTLDAQRIFTAQPVTALMGVRCPRCSANLPANLQVKDIDHWTLELSRDELTRRLRDNRDFATGKEKPLIGPQDSVVGVIALDHRPSGSRPGTPLADGVMGRAVSFAVRLAGNREIHLSGNQFRLALGPGKGQLQSTWLRVESTADKIAFHGKGFGHGVGMCQYGAQFMAQEQQRTHREILATYYPGSRLVRLWGGP